MKQKSHLYILWTNDNPVSAEKKVFTYALDSLQNNWSDKVTVIIWGTASRLVSENTDIQNRLVELRESGVHISACRACADQLGKTENLEKLDIDIEIIFWGEKLKQIIKKGEKLITV